MRFFGKGRFVREASGMKKLMAHLDQGYEKMTSLFGRFNAQLNQDLEYLPLALAKLDLDGAIQELNKGWEELTGYPYRNGIYRSHAGFFHPEDRPRWQEALSQLRSEPKGSWRQLQLRCLMPSGERRWLEVKLRRNPQGFMVSLDDATHQVHQQQQLAARHRSLRNLVDGLPMMIYRCRNNRHWTMEYVSEGAVRLTGYRPEQLVDSQDVTFDSLIFPDDQEAVWSAVQIGLNQRLPFQVDYRLICANGQLKVVHERGSGIYANNGEVLGIEGMIMEVQQSI